MTPQQFLTITGHRLGLSPEMLNYLVQFDPVRKIAYFETPKVGCTSIKKYMQDSVVGNWIEMERKGQVHDRTLSPVRPLTERPVEDIRAVFWGDIKRFTFVRNPYTRVLSGYLDKIVTNQWERDRHLPLLGFDRNATLSLREFLHALARMPEEARDIHFSTQSRLISAGDLTMTFMGCFERFGEDFLHVKKNLFNDDSDETYSRFGKHHASNAGEKVAQYFGPEETELVQEIYGPDFVVFGYSRDISKALAPPDGLDRARKPQLSTVLTRLRMVPFSLERTESFLEELCARVQTSRIHSIQAADILVTAAKAVVGPESDHLIRSAADLLDQAGFPGRADAVRKTLTQT